MEKYISLRDFHAAHAPYSDPNFEQSTIPQWDGEGDLQEFNDALSIALARREARWRWAFADAMLEQRSMTTNTKEQRNGE